MQEDIKRNVFALAVGFLSVTSLTVTTGIAIGAGMSELAALNVKTIDNSKELKLLHRDISRMSAENNIIKKHIAALEKDRPII